MYIQSIEHVRRTVLFILGILAHISEHILIVNGEYHKYIRMYVGKLNAFKGIDIEELKVNNDWI